MKKYSLLSFLIGIALSGFAQNQHSPSFTAEDWRIAALASPKPLEEDALPPSAFNWSSLITDSIYIYDWDNTAADWSLGQKRYFTNDCNLKKPLQMVSHRKGWQVDTFQNDFLLAYNYYPNGIDRNFDFLTWDNDPGIWVHLRHDTLDNLGRWLIFSGKSYDDEDNVFTSGTKDETSYDAAGNQLKYVKRHWDVPTDTYYYKDSTAWSYTTNNQVLEELKLSFETNSQSWVPLSKITNSFDSDGKQLTRRNFKYENNDWKPTFWYDFLYDPQGRLTTMLGTRFDPIVQQFNEYSRNTYAYNAADQLQEILTQYFNNGTYSDYQRLNYAFYANGAQSSETIYRWVAPWQSWKVFAIDSTDQQGRQVLKMATNYNVNGDSVSTSGYRTTYAFNADGMLESETYENLTNNTLDQWVVSSRNSYTYEDTDRLKERLVEYWQSWLGQYVNANKMVYFNSYCIPTPSATNTAAEPASNCIHANPLQPGQAISCPNLPMQGHYRLELFNLSGSLVHSQAFQPAGQLLPNAELPAGIYFMAIQGEQGLVYRAKVVVI